MPATCTFGQIYDTTDTTTRYWCGVANQWTPIAAVGSDGNYVDAMENNSTTMAIPSWAYGGFGFVGGVPSYRVGSGPIYSLLASGTSSPYNPAAVAITGGTMSGVLISVYDGGVFFKEPTAGQIATVCTGNGVPSPCCTNSGTGTCTGSTLGWTLLNMPTGNYIFNPP